jgi:hypothetical protein
MHRSSAYAAVGAMLLALLTAPFFHIHDGDDHETALVHAHLLESGMAVPNPEQAVDHAHQDARSIDVFTVNTAVVVAVAAVAEFSQAWLMPPPEGHWAIIRIETLRTHSPPDTLGINPRSPPAV